MMGGRLWRRRLIGEVVDNIGEVVDNIGWLQWSVVVGGVDRWYLW